MRIILPKSGKYDPAIDSKPFDVQKLHELRLKIPLYFDQFELLQFKQAVEDLEGKTTDED